MPTTPDLSLLKPGSRVKLRGDAKPQPRKPYPRGWKTVAETLPRYSMIPEDDEPVQPVTHVRVESDERWLPVSLIEEIVP
jgi:hypothetical protein